MAARRLLFVENRQKTWFWDAVAAGLQRAGYEIHWVRQSPVFTGKTGISHYIPLPRGADAAREAGPWYSDIAASDRHCRNFGGSPGHYAYYREWLQKVLNKIQPQAVIGEVTLFHELILSKLCCEQEIAYLHPVSARYPDRRLLVFRHDTQHIAATSGETMPEAEARKLADAIARRSTAPFYMRAPSRQAALRKQLSLRLSHLRLLAGWIAGERFNTPSPWRRIRMTWQLRFHLKRWDRLARTVPAGKRAILYPLQMQPECNIDVWGRRFNDQTAVIASMLRASPDDVIVAVKGNPKAKYEVTAALLKLAECEPRLVLLPRGMAMAEAQRLTVGSVTVTGTIGFEAIFGSARCISLAHPLISEEFPEFAAGDVAGAVTRLLEHPEAGRGNAALGARLIQRLSQLSFAGVVSDPTSHPVVMSGDNIETVTKALQRVIAALDVPLRTQRLVAGA